MFANLLAADMNADTKKDAHPAFVELVKEMTPADARVLKLVQQSPRCAFTARVGSSNKFLTMGTQYSFQVEGLNDDDVGRSLNNLERLELLERREEFPATEENDESANRCTAKNQGHSTHTIARNPYRGRNNRNAIAGTGQLDKRVGGHALQKHARINMRDMTGGFEPAQRRSTGAHNQ
jgi:hypothetical protein